MYSLLLYPLFLRFLIVFLALCILARSCGARLRSRYSVTACGYVSMRVILLVLPPSRYALAASGIIAANPDAVVAVCCVEICRCVHFYTGFFGVTVRHAVHHGSLTMILVSS